MYLQKRSLSPGVPTKQSQSLEVNIIEAWGEGFNFGGLIILMLIVLSNVKRGVLLHKLILIEQFLALWHATIIFNNDPLYGWYLSSTVVPLYISYFLHNVIAWLKIKPFLSRKGNWIYMVSHLATVPYWVYALWTNFENFTQGRTEPYEKVRPWEALAREPWWVFTTLYFLWVIKRGYSFQFLPLIRSSPRFGVLLFCMAVSILLAAVDAVIVAENMHGLSGINPFWRISLVFRCAADTIFLDDFKKVLDSLVTHQRSRTRSKTRDDCERADSRNLAYKPKNGYLGLANSQKEYQQYGPGEEADLELSCGLESPLPARTAREWRDSSSFSRDNREPWAC